MISARKDVAPANDNYGRLADYIAAADKGEKCLMSWPAGCWAEDDYDLAIGEVNDTQALNTRTKKEKTYHLVISFRPEDEAKLTPEVYKAIEERFAAALGYSEHQRHCGVHQNTNNLHMHIAYNMIHPERLTMHEPFRDYHTRDRVCRELEKEFGLLIDNGRDKDKPEHLKRSGHSGRMESHTGQQSFESYAKERRQPIIEALAAAASWDDLHTALAGMGMEIKPHGSGLVIKDRHSKKTTIKASAVDRSLSLKKLESRFGAYEQPGKDMPERERYEAKPLQRGPERGNLYSEYKEQLEKRILLLHEIKIQEEADAARIRGKWDQERRDLLNKFLPARAYKKLVASSRHMEKEDMEKSRDRFRKEREAVKTDIPFASWTDYLRQRAVTGDETALAILRSKKKEFAPETPNKRDKSDELAAKRSEIRQEFLAREGDVLTAAGLSGKSQKALLSVLKMERLAAEEAAGTLRRKEATPGEKIFQGIKSRIDNNGIVIFTLPDGTGVRDTGRQIHFSAGSAEAKAVAEIYAAQKWGKSIQLEDNTIMFAPTHERVNTSGLAARRSEIRREFLDREKEILTAHGGLSDKSKALLSVLKMEQLAAEEDAGILRREKATPGGNIFQGIKHSIDSEDIITFTLPDGTGIRDTGKQIVFSEGSAEAKAVAEIYAAQKWGKKVRLEGNQIECGQPRKKQMDRGR